MDTVTLGVSPIGREWVAGVGAGQQERLHRKSKP